MSLLSTATDAFRAVRADRVLWILVATQSARALGRGLLISLSTLYFTRILGVPITTVGTVLFIAAAVGVAASYLGGRAADRWPARWILGVCFLLQAIGFIGYVTVTDASPRSVVMLTIFESLAVGANWFGGTTTQAVTARAFTGSDRVRVQAWLRTVTNAGIAIGGGLAAIPLAIDNGPAYRVTMVVAAGAYLLAGLSVLRLPRSVDADHVRPDQDDPDLPPMSPSPWRSPRFVLLGVGAALVLINFAVTDIGHPQWISAHTNAPPALFSALLVLNTVLVVGLQVPSSRLTRDIPSAGRVALFAGAAFMVAAVLAWAAKGKDPATAAAFMLAAAFIHALGEVASASALWALSFALTPRDRAGDYQGTYSFFVSFGFLAAPLVITRTALTHGLAGWLVLGGVMAAGCLLAVLATRGALPADGTAAAGAS